MTRYFAILLAFLTFASPAYPTATTFDGLDDKISVTSFAGIQATTYSAGCWTYRTADGTGTGGRIMSAEDTSWYLRHSISDAAYLFLHLWDNGGGSWIFARPSQDAWHHVAATYSGTSAANVPVIYVDGVSVTVTEVDTRSGSVIIPSTVLTIGNRTGTDRGWVGHLASCFYYDRVLSLGEIRQVMYKGPQTLRRNLQCYWPLGIFSGRSYGGSGGASCDGTVTGSPGNTGIGPPVSVPQGGMR